MVKGVKWAANLWVWNGPRHPYLFDMKRKKSGKAPLSPSPHVPRKVQAEFTNDDIVAGAELYWEDEVCKLSFENVFGEHMC